jgi:hypothetical protein
MGVDKRLDEQAGEETLAAMANYSIKGDRQT